MSGPAISDLRRHYVELIRHDGVRLSDDLARVFGSVPRELFVTDGFQRRDGTWARPGDRDFLETVYRNDVLVTKLDGRTPISSSSQPSLMAIMLAALDVRPGDRVLEIGAGTGYNAALLAGLGARVLSIDVQPDVADRARAAIARAAVEGVEVRSGDGYAGAPGEPADRVVVTVGVAGVSPSWLAQLDRPGGADPAARVIVPVEHAGTHPVLDVRGRPGGPVTARVVCPSGFMSASGPLRARHGWTHPEPVAGDAALDLDPVVGPRWDPPLDGLVYRDLWHAAGVWSRRVTHAAIRGHDHSSIALLDDDRTGGAAILPDGSVLAGGPDADRWTAAATSIVDRWDEAGRPSMQAWQITMALAGDPDAPIWVPTEWQLG